MFKIFKISLDECRTFPGTRLFKDLRFLDLEPARNDVPEKCVAFFLEFIRVIRWIQSQTTVLKVSVVFSLSLWHMKIKLFRTLARQCF